MARGISLAEAVRGAPTVSPTGRSKHLVDALSTMEKSAAEDIRTPTALWSNLLADAIGTYGADQATKKEDAIRKAAWDQVTPLLGGYQDGPPVQVQAPAAPAPSGIEDASPAIAAATGQTVHAPQSQTQYTAPAKVAPAPLEDPRWGAAIAALQQAGVDPSHIFDWAKANQPDLTFAPDGTAVNKHDAAAAGRVFANRVNVNGQIIDLNDPGNTNRAVPEAPVKGANPVYDNQGNVVDWSLPKGAQGAIGESAAAQSQGAAAGSAPYDFINVPGPDGAPHVIAKSRAVGSTFTGQSPGDKIYSEDTAKAASTLYQGMQTLGQQAPTKIAQLKQIDALMGNFEGGKLAPTGLEIASAMNSMGWPMDKKMSNVQAADALSKSIALQLRDPSSGGGMPGSMSNADRDYLNKMVPGLLQSSAGRRQLIQIGVANYQRQADVAAKARQWQQRFGRIDATDAHGKSFQDYLAAWAEAHPVFGR